MADRYWVGGTANWDGTAGTKWATTSGGAGGASVPTSADDVFFDSNSTGTCTISSGNTGAKSINCTGFTGTIAGSAAITVSGSVTLDAGMTFTYSGTLTFNATATLTTAGKSFGFGSSVRVLNVSTTLTLGDAFTSSGALTIVSGTFNSADYNITASQIDSNNNNTRSINLGSSTVTLASTSTPLDFASAGNLTFNAGTSTIVITSSNVTTFNPNTTTSLTFYNVSFTGTNARTIAFTSTAPYTFNNLSITGPSSAGVVQFSFNARHTFNGALSTTGTAGNRRVWFRGNTYGIAQTLTINSAPSLTDADFRDIYVVGTAAPISGTRIGDLRGCRGITFDTPKNVYWVTAAGGNWSGDNWAASSGGAASTDNFPLAQDTAIIENTGLNTSASVTLDAPIPYFGTIDMSSRTNAMTLAGSTAYTVYGDWKFGSGVARSYSGALTFSGRNTQTITSSGTVFGQALTVDSYGGSLELADAINTGSNTINVNEGTFVTQGYNMTIGGFRSTPSQYAVRKFFLGSSSVTLTGSFIPCFNMNTISGLEFDAGTSSITVAGGSTSKTVNGSSNYTLPLYDFTLNATDTNTDIGNCSFNNLTIQRNASTRVVNLLSDLTVNDTLYLSAPTSELTRIRLGPTVFPRKDSSTRKITATSVSTLSQVDFLGIEAVGSTWTGTNLGDHGGNTNISFASPKTVYAVGAGPTVSWASDMWASSSGGAPSLANYPLGQDTVIIDNASSFTTLTPLAFQLLCSIDSSARTTSLSITPPIFGTVVFNGDATLGTSTTLSTSTSTKFAFGRINATLNFSQNGATINSTIDGASGVSLGSALSVGSSYTVLVNCGFDTNNYSVTVGRFTISSSGITPGENYDFGTSVITLSGTGTVWSYPSSLSTSSLVKLVNTEIVLSDTSSSARTFTGGLGGSYGKLTIGGATGTSTTTITGNNQFTELASTKTVAHTISLGTTTQTFGKWTVTGTSGNVVTVAGSGTAHILAGACTSGLDYLAIGSIRFSALSPGEFYAGANSTATGSPAAPTYLTDKPADSTRYWVGGTGNWNDTNRWSTTSGGAGGADLPRSHDDVVFDSSSNATAYTATVNAITGGNRCKSLTIAGPASGNVTLAGSTALYIHDDITLPATGLTRTYTGAITLTGATSGKTLTTNGVTLASAITVNGVGCEWTLASALNNGSSITITNGLFDCDTYNLTANSISSSNLNSRTIDLGSGTVTLSSSTPLDFGSTASNRAGLTVTSGTTQINLSNASPTFYGNNQTFYNVAFTSVSQGAVTILGENTFNDLSFTGITSVGFRFILLYENQTINGTLTLSAGTNATMRNFFRSITTGTTRTITCNAVSMTDVDFRDITIAGAAAPASGTRIGDCKGNSGITFTTAANKYWNDANGGLWSDTSWATSSGGTPNVNNFPLAQDTCIFEATGLNSGATVTINQPYQIGTIDMSARTSNTMTLASSNSPTIYGNWVNGTGTTITGANVLSFSGRGVQTITSVGKAFAQNFTIESPGGSVVLQDAFSTSSNSPSALILTSGTFDANGYNVSFTGATSRILVNSVTTDRALAIGSGTWVIAGSNGFSLTVTTNFTVTGTGTISLTSSFSKTFAGGGLAYTDITLDQGGAGTLTITGDNTFKNITNSYSATGATTISLGNTGQRVSQWTATGEAGRVLTVQGSSATSPATLVHTGSGDISVDYLTITGVRAYPL